MSSLSDGQIAETDYRLRKMFVFRLLIIQIGLGAFSVMAQWVAPPAINPRDYESPSGEFRVSVDPTDLYGRGDGSYRVSRNGVSVWEGTKTFTLCDARMTDAGLIVGYAYTHGIEGFFKDPGAGAGEFHVVIMRWDGKLLLDETVKRKDSQVLHAPPDPLANGLVVDPASDRFAVRVHRDDLSRGSESWWIYRLS